MATYYKEIEYGTVFPASNLSNFDKLIRITADADIAAALSGGGGIELYLADGVTAVPFGLYPETDLASGTILMRVLTDLLTAASTGDPFLRLRYGASLTTVEDKSGVVTPSGYVLYMTLEENPGGSSPQMLDWVSNSNIGTTHGMSSGDSVAAEVGDGLSCSTSKYVSTTYAGTPTDFTAEINFKTLATPLFTNRLIDKTYNNGFWLGAGTLPGDFGGGVLESGAPYGIYVSGLTLGDWHQLVSRRSGTTHTIYADGGAATTSNTVSGSAISGDPLALADASGGSGGFGFSCVLDEIRVCHMARTNDWLAYAYADMFTNSDTFSLGPQHTEGGSFFGLYKNSKLDGIGGMFNPSLSGVQT